MWKDSLENMTLVRYIDVKRETANNLPNEIVSMDVKTCTESDNNGTEIDESDTCPETVESHDRSSPDERQRIIEETFLTFSREKLVITTKMSL